MYFLQVISDQVAFQEEILLGFIMVFGVFFGFLLWHFFKFRSGHFNNFWIWAVRIKPEYKKILEHHFFYYNQLSIADKKKFEQRVQHFINIKQFIPRELDEVNDEMKTLVAASAIQLTFGLPQVYLTHFKRILIYPEDYFSTIHHRYHRGEVNLSGGIIVLAWKHFKEGYLDQDDSINLGLHELAHALRLENTIFNQEYQFLDKTILKKWDQISTREMIKMKKDQNHLFRSYAAVNEHEFFAVAVENFFERPLEFYRRNQEMYEILARLLNQDTYRMYQTKEAK